MQIEAYLDNETLTTCKNESGYDSHGWWSHVKSDHLHRHVLKDVLGHSCDRDGGGHLVTPSPVARLRVEREPARRERRLPAGHEALLWDDHAVCEHLRRRVGVVPRREQ